MYVIIFENGKQLSVVNNVVAVESTITKPGTPYTVTITIGTYTNSLSVDITDQGHYVEVFNSTTDKQILNFEYD